IYTDLLKIGLTDDSAREIAEAVQRHAGLVTVSDLDVRLAKLETALTRIILSTMIAMTGTFAVFVAGMAWVIDRP
ncbi:MAG: hypothetical protein ACRDFA_07335, partial [bacterium]